MCYLGILQTKDAATLKRTEGKEMVKKTDITREEIRKDIRKCQVGKNACVWVKGGVGEVEKEEREEKKTGGKKASKSGGGDGDVIGMFDSDFAPDKEGEGIEQKKGGYPNECGWV